MSLLTPAAAPSADGADRQFAQIHLDRLVPPACERQRRGLPPGTQIRHRRHRRRFEQGRQGSPSSSLASRSTANLGEVTGLGLPIARKLAKLMRGDIGCRAWAASIGSRFRHSTRDLNQRSGSARLASRKRIHGGKPSSKGASPKRTASNKQRVGAPAASRPLGPCARGRGQRCQPRADRAVPKLIRLEPRDGQHRQRRGHVRRN